MARHIKSKKQNLFLENFSKTLFGFSLIAFFLSSIFLRTYNVHLSVQIQDMENRMVQLSQDNEVLNRQISSLSSKERVVAIAYENGLASNQKNIVLVQSGD